MNDTTKEWELWARTLANSTNPKDIDLLVAKIAVLLSSQKQAVVEMIWRMRRSENPDKETLIVNAALDDILNEIKEI